MTTAIGAPVRAPYKGLSPFDESDIDALLFFGRERETELVVANALAARLTVLYGPTGVGKSSVLRAGAVHALRRLSATEPVAVAYFSSWAGDPVTGIDEAVRGALAEAFGGDPGDAPGDAADRIDGWTAALGAQLVLVLDQFEEHFLYHEDEGGVHDLLPELVTRPGLRVHVVLGIRDDELARLDVFKAQVPGLFSNYLRLERLTRDEGRAAILGPLERYNELADDHVEIEPQLVETVLGEVALGRIDAGLAGRSGGEDRTRIETPYLQLVMQRLWDVERERRSSVLRLSTLAELGGAQQIVEDHLQRAMTALTPAQQEVAAGMFDHLVTPSGTKIAHGVADLASFAHVDVGQLQPVLSSLARERILRPTGERGTGGDRYEIYHDVLAGAVLGWKAQHEAEVTLERERTRAHARQRRLAIVAGISVAAFTLMAALAAYAFSQRSTARHQTAVAQLQQANAVRAEHAAQHSANVAHAATQRALAAKKDADRQRKNAQDASRKYRREATRAHRLSAVATSQKNALAQKNGELTQNFAELARRKTALGAATVALQKSNDHLKAQTDKATRATIAEHRQTLKARDATKRALAGQKLQKAQLEVLNDPIRSVRDALESARMQVLPKTEDVLRSSLLAMRVLAALPAGGTANELAYSPDASRIAVASSAGQVRVFAVPSGRRLLTLATGAPVVAVVWSPDGRTVAGGSSSGGIWLWDATTGAVERTLAQAAPLVGIAFSPNGRVFEASGGHDTNLWDAATGLPLATLSHGERHVRSASFSDDSSLLVTTVDQNVARVWDVATGTLLQPLQTRSTINAAAFGPGGRLLVTGSQDGTARIWDPRTGAVVENLIGHTASIRAVAFSPAGDRVATASTDGTVRVWSTTTGLTDVIRGFTSPVVDVAFSPDGLSGVGVEGNGREITFGVGQVQTPLDGQIGSAHGAAFAPDGLTLATAIGTSVRLFEPYGEPRLNGIHKHDAAATSLAFDPTGKLLASADASGTVVVQKAHGGPVRTFAAGAPVVALGWAANGTMLVATGDGTLHVRAGNGSQESGTIRSGASKLVAAALRADGRVAASGASDGVVTLWDVKTRARLLDVHAPRTLTSLALDPRGRFLALGVGDDVVVYDATNGKFLRTLAEHVDTVTAVAFSPDGSRLASSSRDRDARVWRTNGFREIALLHRHASFISGVAFSGDGRWIATAGASKAGVWSPFASSDLPGNFLFFARGTVAPFTAVAWSPRGWELATAARDGSVRVLDCALCGGLRQLEAYANTRLRSLER
jgi:WD40 repeat protein